jgi:hypothetical protein
MTVRDAVDATGGRLMAMIDPHSIISWLLAAAFALGWTRVERQLRKW